MSRPKKARTGSQEEDDVDAEHLDTKKEISIPKRRLRPLRCHEKDRVSKNTATIRISDNFWAQHGAHLVFVAVCGRCSRSISGPSRFWRHFEG